MPPLLAKGLALTSFLPPPLPRPSLRQPHLPLLTSPLRITLSARPLKRRDDIPFIADYLVKSFRFSFHRALELSTDPRLAGIQSLDQPESVVGFLKDVGLSDSQIKTRISSDPLVLSYSVEKDLKPWAHELEANGCTTEILVQLIQSNPTGLALKDSVLRLWFWRDFVDNDDEVLLKIFQKNRFLFHCNIDGYVVPRLNLLREYGLSNQQIVSFLSRGCGLMFQSLGNLRWVFEKTQELGLHSGSRMFLKGIIVVGSLNEITLNQKIEFFKKSGWSVEEVHSAFRKFPRTLLYTEERIKTHTDFLIRKAGLDLRSIASYPCLLGFSMEKKLVPRHHVLTMLKAHGLKKRYKLLTACALSEQKFLGTLVVPHEKDVPGLLEAYYVAWSGEVPPPCGASHASSPRHSLRSTPFIADYLISSFGFSFDRALKLSTDPRLAGIQSLDQPESVVGFLKDIGLSDSQIKTRISSDPLVLSYSVEKDLKPWAHELKANGCTTEILVQLIQSNPTGLALKDSVLRLWFWRVLVDNDDEVLLKIFQKNRFLFHCNIDGYVVPRLNLLREYGLSNQQIVSFLSRGCGLMFQSLGNLRWVFEKTQELGLHSGSRMFLKGIIVVGSLNEITLNQKIEFFKKSGWSVEEVHSAFRKFPRTLLYTEERIKTHMDFLIRKAGLDLRSIASDPCLLGFSMEKKLVPRHHVLTMLKAHGLKKRYKLLTACVLSEEKFLGTLVVPHEKDVPGLLEAYSVAWSGEVPPPCGASHASSPRHSLRSTPFIADYLISSFGFSFDRALKVSADTYLARIKSSEQPDSVVRILTDIGLSDHQIKTLISSYPVLLSYSLNKHLRLWARKLMAAGFSREILVQLIQHNPKMLSLKNPVSRVQFWREFVGNDDEALVRVIQKNRFLFYCNIEKYIVPRLNLFREYGLSEQHIVSLLMKVTGLMFQSLDNLLWIVEKTQELGFNPGSKMFSEGIIAVGSCTKDSLNQRIELLKSYGLSEDDVFSVLRKYPKALNYTEKRIKCNMDFLIRKARLDPRTIVSHPYMIGFSMKKRVVPRHHVLTILKAHGLKKSYTLSTACHLSEDRFLKKLVAPYEKDVPGLRKAYAAAFCGKVSL